MAMNEEERLEEIRNFNLERRLMRDGVDPFSLNDIQFKDIFRLTKDMAHYVLNRVLPEIHTISCSMNFWQNSIVVAIPPHIKFFATLSFYATGSYQRLIGQSYNISLSQQVVSRAIDEVSTAIVNVLSQEYINFPTTAEAKVALKRRFLETTQFPGVIGAVDCTHIAILAPRVEEHNYLNRKGYHSKNVQIICDYDLKILNINARYAGATHDAFIWRNSQILRELQRCYNEGDRNTWLLGDSGYPQQPWLMTPIPNALENTPEARYNTAHARCRNCIEHCNGVLKSRFRCLLEERKLRYSPDKVGKIINACAILHNICIDGQLEHNFNLLEEENMPPPHVEDRQFHNEGAAARQNVVQRYFL